MIPADTLTTANRRRGVAGGTLTAGMPVYLSNNTYLASRTNAAATALCDGIVLNGASSGQPVDVQLSGNLALGATLTIGMAYYVSANTAGKIWPITDVATNHVPVYLGIATNSTNLNLSIQESPVAKA